MILNSFHMRRECDKWFISTFAPHPKTASKPDRMNVLRFCFVFWVVALPNLIPAQEAALKVPDKQFDLHAYQAAMEGYKAYLADHPDDLLASLGLARSYFMINQPKEAVGIFLNRPTQQSLSPSDQVLFAQALMMVGNYPMAEELWSDLASSFPVVAGQGMLSCQFARNSVSDQKTAKVKAELINSAHSEIGPCLLKDQLYLNVFNPTLATYPDGWVQGDQYHYVMSTTVDGNGFLYPPRPVKLESRPTPNMGPVTFSPDGRTAVFMRANIAGNARFTPEAGFQSSLFIADVNEKGTWENIRPFPFNNSSFSTAWPRFSASGQELYFASDNPEGLGGFDIYVCEMGTDGWKEPRNMGSPLNSPGNEITPFPDHEMMYFSSDWHTGLGGFDLFKAIRTNGHYTNISHLGQDINSSGDDLGLIIGPDPAQGYFVSNRKGRGDLDIYQFHFQLIERHLVIQDAVTGNPIAGATIDLQPCGGDLYRSDDQGLITLKMTEIPSCKLVVQHQGHSSAEWKTHDLLSGDEVISIHLTPDRWKFTLTVIDSESARPLQHVQLRLAEQRSGLYNDLYTNEKGQLNVPMGPDRIYFLNFSLPGYQHEARTIQLSLTSGNPFEEPVQLKAIQANLDAEEMADKQEKDALSGKDNSTGQATFSVQVASLTNEKEADVSEYERLAQYGTVYQKIDEDRIRIRVGVFSSREQAQAAAAEITGIGFPGSFVVEESVESLMDRVMLSMARDKSGDPGQDGEYLIRLAAYKNARWFDPGALGTFGTITRETTNEWTIMYVSGIKSISVAREALSAARGAGFHDARILFDRHGQRLNVD